MTDYFTIQLPADEIRGISSIGLAHLGDGVYELLVRTWLCAHGKATGKGLHRATIELIIKGVLSENDQLPSVRALAKELGVNPNTVAKAYQELERSKVIYSLSGRGSFISRISDMEIKEYALIDFDKSVREALKAGVTPDELKNRIDAVTEKERSAP